MIWWDSALWLGVDEAIARWKACERTSSAVAFERLEAVLADDRARCAGRWVKMGVAPAMTGDPWLMPFRTWCRWQWGIDRRPEPRQPPQRRKPAMDAAKIWEAPRALQWRAEEEVKNRRLENIVRAHMRRTKQTNGS